MWYLKAMVERNSFTLEPVQIKKKKKTCLENECCIEYGKGRMYQGDWNCIVAHCVSFNILFSH